MATAVIRARGRVRAGDVLSPARVAAGLLAAVALVLVLGYGVHDVAQRTVNGLVDASYIALGAVGMTLLYGILRLVNFAHGDMLTLGAYVALLFDVGLGLPLIVAIAAAAAAVALTGLGCERMIWAPLRRRGAGMLQMLLATIALAFILRNGIQFVWGGQPRRLDADVTTSIELLGVRVGVMQLIVMAIGIGALVALTAMLKRSRIGKEMRAVSDDAALAASAGIDTRRVVVVTWVLAGALAGLAGALFAAAVGTMTPNLGFQVLLTLFAAVIMGGIGNPLGALAGGVTLGLVQAWSTLVVPESWKLSVGFAVLIVVLIARPQGIFGREARL
jgi:neutral amino acid transport system permease protein